MISSGELQFATNFQLKPIVLVGGIAGAPGATLSLFSLTDADQFSGGILSTPTSSFAEGFAGEAVGAGAGAATNSANTSIQSFLNQFFGYFEPLPGATLEENEVAHFPFANQAIAGNAVIADPIHISMKWICPVAAERGGYAKKTSTFSALKNSLDQHILKGGLFNVNTPAYLYQNCVLLSLRCIDGADSHQSQYIWQWDFEKPLVTSQDAQLAYSAQTAKMANFVAQSGDPPQPSGPNVTSDSGPNTAGQATQPAQSGTAAGWGTGQNPGL